ncbi:uncharacterized protein LOC121267709 [Juglans microcarpa x Juglans regia]|uniref:uncharacterized protein LOC121267709 n=1 Tax=Juglans microcarpa x Juglans regia TaxID=2249226 RepID=UPI001B7EE530|nr:uncharacterized protein LOC121267709 [Juglans microcarpa x Juglans regia]
MAFKNAYPNSFRIAREKEAMVADVRVVRKGSQEWNINLTREAQDWEVSELVDFFSLLYNITTAGPADDIMEWRPSKNGKFSVHSFYDILSAQDRPFFPWKNIWRSKAPPKAAFFVWTAALRKILTMDNLRRRGLIITDWCCMCRNSGETIDHLLLHCDFARDIWTYLFSNLGVTWVMPGTVVELLASWRGITGTPQIVAVWKMVDSLRIMNAPRRSLRAFFGRLYLCEPLL